MALVTYRIEGDRLPIRIQTAKGSYLITAKTIVSPDGDRCLVYDRYSVSLNTVQPSATDIEYYVGEIRTIVDLYEQGFSNKEILKRMTQDHINQHGRVIDNDLMMTVSALKRTINAIEGNCDSKALIISAIDVVLNNFIDYAFVTVYKHSPYGIQPQLVKMREYMK